MKNLFLFALMLIAFFSCKKDEGFVKFDKSKYTLHYDGKVNLELTSSENTSLFRYYVNTPNVVSVSSSGVAEGLYVGETKVVAKYEDLSAECSVIVEPYENLYRMIPLITAGLDRNTVKFLEKAIDRDTLPAPQNVLLIAPAVEDIALEKLEYFFENDHLISVSAYLKDDTGQSNISRFLNERYPYKEGAGYEDAGSGADVSYSLTANKIMYTW